MKHPQKKDVKMSTYSTKRTLFVVTLLTITTTAYNDTPVNRRALQEALANKSLPELFTKIYETNYWYGKESRSGRGSSKKATETIREILPHLVSILNIKTVLDAACGDCNWMQLTNLDLDQYIGVDIVPALIQRNKAEHSDTKHTFLCLDITKDTLARTDLILCRDCLAHLTHAQGLAAIKNFKKTGAKYLMITTHPKTTHNVDVDIRTGLHHPVNMELAPYNFPKPMMLVDEASAEPETRCQEKCLGVWKLEDIIVND